MKLRLISIIIILFSIIILGCINNKDEVIYTNSDYPYFNITNVSTLRPDPEHYTINITLTNDIPEKIVKYNNGSIAKMGKASTQTINISHYGRNLSQNITLSYNETKVVTIDLGTLTPGNNTVILETPSMNTTFIAWMWNYGI